MANSVYILEAANLFCGDHNPVNSKHLTLEELTLPDLQGVFADHMPGGGTVGVEWEVGIQKLAPTFKLRGWDPVLLAQFGDGSRTKNTYTAYGSIRDERTGGEVEVKAVMVGRLGRTTPDAFVRGQAMSFQYAINSVTHYELYFDGSELFYWDFFTSAYRTGGTERNAERNRILRIANVTG